MYQNESFFVNSGDRESCFEPKVITAFKICADKSYYHYCDIDEKGFYPKKTVAFIRCIEGKGCIFNENKKLYLNENECIFIDFHSITKYKSLSDVWRYTWVNFTCNMPCNEFSVNKVYTIPYFDNESKAFDKLLSYGKDEKKNAGHINALFTNYFYCVMLESVRYNEDILKNKKTKTIDEMCGYINQKLFSKLTAEEVALFFKISERRLHQIFTKELGISPKQYIMKKKMEEGYKLIVQTTMPINKISEMLCFSSPYHFSNQFKNTFSITPTALRRL